MQLSRIALVGTGFAIALFAGQSALQAGQVRTTSAPTPQPQTATLISQAAPALRSGTFVGDAHPTAGTARIIEADGQRFLELGNGFSTDRGPDLFVLLHRSAVPDSYSASDYVNLGRLEQVQGTQRYLIPDDISAADFASAVIWCRQFNVTFGYASLS
ncbi:DM13 domain-containing protein [Romeria aff. gracilis LEGE 07310]|uniref:DM13 domain-containing protein n=1 Tax=Vasconcelosia minhoensis LEGE 07310 TaxID=915328 RepID=A0A8J7AKQ2_9CYAN|nr:DM13 domain-containing protein [Romeria gracilis]MBE9076920.1 DM13 domain-containing protein [Romeria aff. gracilis LEGE 07310]